MIELRDNDAQLVLKSVQCNINQREDYEIKKIEEIKIKIRYSEKIGSCAKKGLYRI